MTPDDLVERVAAVLASVEYLDKPPNHTHRRLARAAIAVLRPALRAEALEEAARVAECRNGAAEWSVETNSGYECAAREIAAAIRALIRKEKE